jgi:hypothetical protein
LAASPPRGHRTLAETERSRHIGVLPLRERVAGVRLRNARAGRTTPSRSHRPVGRRSARAHSSSLNRSFLPSGKNEWAMRGPRSRAGLMAYSVVPPSDSPIAQTRTPTKYGSRSAAGPDIVTRFEKIAAAATTSTNVPMTSLKKLAPKLRIAGIVEKQRSFTYASSV